MPKLTDLLQEKAKAEIQVGGATFSFTYFVLWRDRFNEAQWEEVLAATGRDYLRLFVPRVVESWDIVDDDGHAIPVTPEAFEQHHMPDALLVAIERRVAGGDLAGKGSSAN